MFSSDLKKDLCELNDAYLLVLLILKNNKNLQQLQRIKCHIIIGSFHI